jgi:hypothetical protein
MYVLQNPEKLTTNQAEDNAKMPTMKEWRICGQWPVTM